MKLILLDSQIDKVKNDIKIHSTVSDPNNKLKVGNKVDCLQISKKDFNPEIILTQSIEIAVRKNANNFELIYLQIDKQDCSDKLNDIAKNEGFDSIQEYLAHIYETAEEYPRVTLHVLRGKIIHWADTKY